MHFWILLTHWITRILHIGAGKDLEDASRTEFMELDGLKIAFLNGSRVEWAEQTKGATADSPGVFRTVDPALLYQRVEEAKQEADLVIVYMHWGIESVEYLEDYQKEVGKGLVDHGADAVIGDHTHCLQGIEFYRNAPIIYSLGHFWFNGKTQRTALAELHVQGTRSDYSLQLQYLPAMQDGCTVYCIKDPAAQSTYYRYLESISPNCVFDEEGNCTDRYKQIKIFMRLPPIPELPCGRCLFPGQQALSEVGYGFPWSQTTWRSDTQYRAKCDFRPTQIPA